MNNLDNKNLNNNNDQNQVGTLLKATDSGLTYTFAIALYLIVALLFNLAFQTFNAMPKVDQPDWYIYLSFCCAPLALLVVSIGMKRRTKVQFKDIGYRPCNYIYFIFAIAITLGLLGSLSWVNNYFIKLLTLMGYKQQESSVLYLDLSGARVIIAVFIICVLPAIFEETIFRGFVLEGTKKFGTVLSIVFSGLLFSIYHMNPAQTIYQFICGGIFALLAIRSKSVLPSILAHFLNNALVIVLFVIFGEDFTFPWYFILISAVLLIGSLVYLIVYDKKTNESKQEKSLPFLKMAGLGIGICVIMWVAALIQAFFVG